MLCNLDYDQKGRKKNKVYLRRTAILLWRRRQSKCLVVGGRGLHMVVIVVAEAAKKGAENTSTPVLL